MSKIVVVGANHAGTFSINTILDNYGDQNEVVVFDQNSNISFLGCGMALWIGNQISGSDGLFYANKEGLESKGAKVYMNSPVAVSYTHLKSLLGPTIKTKCYLQDKMLVYKFFLQLKSNHQKVKKLYAFTINLPTQVKKP